MTKIKYIHCFGTSYTAGGGFEFNSIHENNNNLLTSVYKYINDKKNQFNFSWPGQLQKLIGNDVFVLNQGKQGYGNDRMIRLSYELINNPDFNPDENLFILEFAGFGRDEFFFKEIGDFIVCNYQMLDSNDNNLNFKFVGAANSYGYDTLDVTKIIDSYDEFFNTYVNKFIDFEINESKLTTQADLFLSYLEKKNINFLFSIAPILDYEYDKSKHIIFGDGNYFKKSNNFVKFTNENKLRIIDETNELVNDGHCGYKANKIIAHSVYNKIIEYEYINNIHIPINWVYYYNKNYLKPII